MAQGFARVSGRDQYTNQAIGPPSRVQAQPFRPECQQYGAGGRLHDSNDRTVRTQDIQSQAIGPHHAGQYVGRTKKFGDETAVGAFVDLRCRADLRHPPVAYHADAVGHRQRFLLIVGDKNKTGSQLAPQTHKLLAGFGTQGTVEGRKRLIQQQQRGPGRQASGKGDPLLLAAGKLVRAAIRVSLHTNKGERLRDPGSRRCPAEMAQTKGHIGGDSQMGKQRIGLEDRIDRAPMRRLARQVFPGEFDAARGWRRKTRDRAKEGGFPGPGGAKQHEHFIPADRQGQGIECQGGTVPHREVRNTQEVFCRHARA